jgi:uncharacterized membrane protein
LETGSATFGRPLRRTATAAMLLPALLAPTRAAAQPTQSTAPAQQIEAPRQVQASLGHSMAKAVTLKIATFTIGTAVYAFGTGSLAEGAALSAVNAAGSFVLFTVNDYGWDYLWPNTNVSANGSFLALTSLSRNTAKYLTLKPMLTAMNLGTVYWWTGSAATTAVAGGAIVLGLPLAFYLNNTLWDWYDWHVVSK